MDGEGRRLYNYIYLSLHCHHQNDSCIKMGSDECHFKCFINCEGQGHKTVSTETTNFFFFFFEEKGEPKRNRAEAFLLTILTP